MALQNRMVNIYSRIDSGVGWYQHVMSGIIKPRIGNDFHQKNQFVFE